MLNQRTNSYLSSPSFDSSSSNAAPSDSLSVSPRLKRSMSSTNQQDINCSANNKKPRLSGDAEKENGVPKERGLKNRGNLRAALRNALNPEPGERSHTGPSHVYSPAKVSQQASELLMECKEVFMVHPVDYSNHPLI